MAETGDRITRIYANFRGVDFRGEEINIVRSPDSLNVWKDYRETESIRTRPGMRLDAAFDEPVYGIFFFGGVKIVHSGNKLYRVSNGAKTVLFSGVRAYKSQAFAYGNKLYIKDGMHYLVFDGTTIKDVEPYVPTTSIARKPASYLGTVGGGGTVHEDVNLLTGRRINTFLATGKNMAEDLGYFLDAQNIDTDFAPIVKVDGKVLAQKTTTTSAVAPFEEITVNRYEVDYKKGLIKFTTYYTPPTPKTDGKDNVSIEFRKTVAGYSDRIHKCTLLQVFDNRVFFSGNPDYPNVVYHCSLDDPSYCSDLDYYNEGLDTAAVRGLVAGNNVLWVFREPSSANTTVFYHTPTIDSEYGKIYPSQHSSVTTGCIGKAINFNDDIVFFSERGMEGISGDITTEQVVAHRSSLVDRKLLASDNYRDMVLEEWEGYLLVFLGNRVFLADSRTAFTNENHIEYDWFYWELDRDVYSTCVKDGVLYIGASDGVYTLNDNERDIESYWVTPKDKFKAPQMQKTTNKRGCVVEATGDISVYAKVEDTDFELIGSYENITDYIACRIKRKKFKDIQLKFHSRTRFSLETATLECFIGGYIKR
jgi:hypothetical protein